MLRGSGQRQTSVTKRRERNHWSRGTNREVPPDEELALFFYSSPAPGYVHLHSVHRADDRLIIKYKVIPHLTTEITAHFAFIPLGKLPDGEYRVEIERIDTSETSPPGMKIQLNVGQINRAVCTPCSFDVGMKLL